LNFAQGEDGDVHAKQRVLGRLAMVYADHPDLMRLRVARSRCEGAAISAVRPSPAGVLVWACGPCSGPDDRATTITIVSGQGVPGAGPTLITKFGITASLTSDLNTGHGPCSKNTRRASCSRIPKDIRNDANGYLSCSLDGAQYQSVPSPR
jgi:hypothetical protein